MVYLQHANFMTLPLSCSSCCICITDSELCKRLLGCAPELAHNVLEAGAVQLVLGPAPLHQFQICVKPCRQKTCSNFKPEF